MYKKMRFVIKDYWLKYSVRGLGGRNLRLVGCGVERKGALGSKIVFFFVVRLEVIECIIFFLLGKCWGGLVFCSILVSSLVLE